MNNNSPTNEIVIHHFIRKIRREMNWRKRSLGLNAIEANQVQSLLTFQKDTISYLEYIALSMKRINAFIRMHSKQKNLPIDVYLSSSNLCSLIKSMKITAKKACKFPLQSVHGCFGSIGWGSSSQRIQTQGARPLLLLDEDVIVVINKNYATR